MFKENTTIKASLNKRNGKWQLDYYVVNPNGSREYLITRPYVRKCYDMCKGGIRYNDLIKIKSRNRGEMLLVNCMKQMDGYLGSESDAA